MSLADVVRSGISIANTVTEDGELQLDVTLEAWTGSDAHGAPTYATAVSIPAIVEMKNRLVKLKNGEVVASRAQVTFLRPVTANGATGRREPIDPRDKITLPDGETGPILDVEGLFDSSTNAPYMLSVFLG
jgi:hypothetical protein